MARKFKKRLAPKKVVKKTKTPVLSVELVRKEYIEKFKALISKILSSFKT